MRTGLHKVIGGHGCPGCNPREEDCDHDLKETPLFIFKNGEWMVGCKKCGKGVIHNPTEEDSNRIKGTDIHRL